MSSHHFVKEGQEAALVILDDTEFETVGPLLEWAPFVIVFGPCAEKANSWGIKIDAVVCETGLAARFGELLHDQVPLEMITYNSQAESTSKVIDYLISRGESSATFISNDRENVFRRLDDLKDAAINVILICHGTKWSLIDKRNFEKWLPEGMAIGIHPANVQVGITNLVSVGTELKVIKTGMVRIAGEGPFWVGEPT